MSHFMKQIAMQMSLEYTTGCFTQSIMGILTDMNENEKQFAISYTVIAKTAFSKSA